MNLCERFALIAKKYPSKTAVIFDDTSFSYENLLDNVRKTSFSLRKMGVSRGTHIGIMLENSMEFLYLLFAAADIGAVIVTLYETLSVVDFVRALKSSDVSYLFSRKGYMRGYVDDLGESFPLGLERCVCVGAPLEGMIGWNDFMTEKEVPCDILDKGQYEDDYFIVLTSGSTGNPKPIVISQKAEFLRCLGAWEMHGLSEDDVLLVSTPLHHSLALFAALLALSFGMTAVLMRNFTKESFLEVIKRHSPTYAVSTSDQLARVVEEFEAGASCSLRVTLATSAPIRKNLRERLLDTPCGLHECYGTTEIGFATNVGPEEIKENPRTVGRACPEVEIKVVDEMRKTLPAGEVGEIAVRTPLMFSCYYKNTEATKQSLAEGFFYTGDLGKMDEKGYLYYVGRKKELIKSGGISVFPLDIENVLNQHPKVKESAVIGIADKELGEAVFALVIPKEEEVLSERELKIYCASHLADHQQPVAFEFVQDFPRSGPGKVMKKILVEKYKGVSVRSRF